MTVGSHQEFVDVSDRIEAGLPVIVDEEFPLEAYPQAIEKLSKGDQLGKLVLLH